MVYSHLPSDGTLATCCRQSKIAGETNNYDFLREVRLQWYKFEKATKQSFRSWQDSWLAFASTKPVVTNVVGG